MSEFDFVVIGGGSAGYAGARTAAALGLKTAVIEGGEELGGLCILRGCMPSKTLLESANRFRTLRRAEEFGLRAGDIGFDPGQIRERKRRLIKEFADYRAEQLQAGRFELIRGRAVFEDAHRVGVERADGTHQSVTSKTFLLATGSIVNFPKVPGLDLPGVWTSDDLLEADQIPESVAILGAGPVGLEAAHYYEALGSKVTIVQRSARILKSADPDISSALETAFLERGVRICSESDLVAIRGTPGAMQVVIRKESGEETLEVAMVLNAMGRRPNTDKMQLENAGVRLERGYVSTEEGQQTTCAHIFAAGDVAGPHEIVHIAIQQGEMAARNAARQLGKLEGAMETMDYRLKLFAVFTEPQVAMVGLTEAEALSQGIPFRTASHPFSDHGKSMVRGETEGLVKLLARTDTGEIIGGSVVGPEGSDLIHEIVVAMAFRSTAAQLAAVPHYHPTLSEIWTYPAEELAESPSEG